MATEDLGSIDTRTPDEVRVTPVTTPGLGEDLLGGLMDLGGIVEKKKIRESFTDTTDEALSTGNDDLVAKPDDDFMGPPREMTQEEEQIQEIRELQRKARLGNASVRERVNIDLRRKIAEATAANPVFGQLYAQELERFTNIDPEYRALLALDAERDAISKEAQSRLDDIKDYGYDELGISPRHAPGSQQFAEEFSTREAIDQSTKRSKAILENYEAMQDLDFVEQQRLYEENWTGVNSQASRFALEIQEDLSLVRRAMLDPTAPNAPEIIQAWQVAGKQEALDYVANMEREAMLSFSNINAKYSDQASYEKLRAAHNERMEVFANLRQGISQDIPSLVSLGEAANAAWRFRFEGRNPEITEQLRVIKQATPLFEAMDGAFNAQNLIEMNKLAGIVIPSVVSLFGEMTGESRVENLPELATVDQVRDQLAEIRAENPLPYGDGVRGGRRNRQMNVLMAESILDPGIVSQAPNMTPDVALSVVLGNAQKVARATQGATIEPEGAIKMLAPLGNPDVLKLAERAYQAQPAAVEVWAQELQKVDGQYSPYREREYTDNFLTVPVGREALGSLITAEIDTDNGTVRLILDETRAKQALSEVPHTSIPGRGGQPVYNPMALRDVQALVSRYSQIFTRDLQYKATLQALFNQSFKADYQLAADSALSPYISLVEE